jgi:aldehyde:ferredoxin oxidoreductase
MGKILRVDLSTGVIEEEAISDSVYERCLSGSGLGIHVLHNEILAGADPLGPNNILGFISGLLTGSGSMFTGRWMVVGKSPLTGGWGEANCGGTFSPAIKKCGYDGIFFKGVSRKPVYLYINEEQNAELIDASNLWGNDTIDTEQALITKHRKKRNHSVACIGPAGERLSLISGISNDKGRMAARSGLGAVMGSKKLKAIVLAGTKRIKSNNKQTIKELNQKCLKWVKFQPPFLSGVGLKYLGALMRVLPFQIRMDGLLFKFMLSKWGTVSLNQFSIETGDAPIKNWAGSHLDYKNVEAINPDNITNYETKKYFCYSCPLGCGGILNSGPTQKDLHKPEYESVLALGGLCLNKDMESIYYMNDLLNRAGMDTISAGTAIAFAIECFEKGILTQKDTDGLELEWGNKDTLIALIKKMILRQGIGDVLADGVHKASLVIQKGSEKYAMHAGGQELPMHDSRLDPGFAVHYTVEATPGRHTFGSLLYYEMFKLWEKIPGLPKPKLIYLKKNKYLTGKDKSIQAWASSRYTNVINGSGACMFGAFLGASRFPLFEWLNAASGLNNTPDEYLQIGENVQKLKQAFNRKHGISHENININKRALGIPPRPVDIYKNVKLYKIVKDYQTFLGLISF